jgi:hypothetical protein
MKRILLLAVIILATLAGCSSPEDSTLNLEFDFRNGSLDWKAGFAQYSPEMEDIMELEAGIRPLPPELGIDGTGYYLRGMNRSDDLVMFLRHCLGPEDGIVPGKQYRITIRVMFASNAPSGAVGIGGPPGEAVVLWGGAAPEEPEVYLDGPSYKVRLSKEAVLSPMGDIANGLPAEEVDLRNPPYVLLERECELEEPVSATSEGELWIMVGTRSGFEGSTALYYQSIAVTLEPVE